MLKSIALLTAAATAAVIFTAPPGSAAEPAAKEFRAVWVASVLNLDYPSKKALPVEKMMAEADDIINRARETGLNAIILQVRPCSDALYNSGIFPWSDVLTGRQGLAPDWGFDPLAYWTAKAHQKGLELHAWINPYRVTHTSQKITDVNKLAANNPARKNPERVAVYKGALYYDPGLPENRKLIVDGAKEILSNYDVDGIHMDDYFYPGADFPDDAAHRNSPGRFMDKDEWRRENVNALIQELRQAVREVKPGARFGVSPFGIWRNKSSSPLGSDTSGTEAYKTMYADTRLWVTERWVDYICPQIYWYIGYKIADYEKLLNWWAELCAASGVDLYVGHAAYREAGGEKGWSGEMLRQLKLNERAAGVSGSVFFRAASLKGDLGRRIQNYYLNKGKAPSVVMSGLSVSQPAKAAVSLTNPSGYTILGACDPAKDLNMNGELVTNRTPEGFFSVYVKLAKGDNTFRFTQEGKPAVVRTITSKAAAVPQPETMDKPGVKKPFPAVEEYVSPGDLVTLSVTAPAGASVKVKLNGRSYDMTSKTAAPDNKKIYAAAYGCVFTVPSGQTSDLTSLGAPEYTAVYNNKVYTAGGSRITVIKPGAPYYAAVTADAAFVYKGASTDGGSSWRLLNGQKDFVTAISKEGEWARLSAGYWIETKNITYGMDKTAAALSEPVFRPGDTVDRLTWRYSGAPPALYAEYDGERLSVANGGFGVDFPLAPGARPEGYYVEFDEKEISLCVKKPRKPTEGEKPLAGFSFVVDAGHGDGDNGAVGPMGTALCEKHLNLINAGKLAERLRALGANVTETRDSDTFFTLDERTEISRKINPDMFISIHANSMGETTDSSNVRGLSVWYRNELSKPLSERLAKSLHMVNPLTTRRAVPNQSNFYVCRPSWCPSVIIETSFVCNIEDFAWLIDGKNQDVMADAISGAVVEYYRGY
jgi:uncharacterized lipoprotein YddW (UPF0748 family)/N-acetylmuramoyl-L-alanine amidase